MEGRINLLLSLLVSSVAYIKTGNFEKMLAVYVMTSLGLSLVVAVCYGLVAGIRAFNDPWGSKRK